MPFGLSYNLFGFDLGGVHLNFDEIDPSQGITNGLHVILLVIIY
jgi:hypothetical protein